MKNVLIVLVIWVIAYWVWDYTQEQKAIQNAKEELGLENIQSNDNKINQQNTDAEPTGGLLDNINETFDEISKDIEEVTNKKPETFTVTYLTDNEFIKLDDLVIWDIVDGTLEITGTTLTQVDSIRVQFSNDSSDYPDDDYTLGQFKSWDDTFLYRAFSQYQVFDFGTNIYKFIATSWDQESIIELQVYYPEETQQEDDAVDNEIHWEIDMSQLPEGVDYGSPIKVSESTISYSDIAGLEISAIKDMEFSCNNEYILSQTQRLDLGTIWWNTCRPNTAENSISYFVLNMDEGKYSYAKHYVSKNYYAVLNLENWNIENWEELETQELKDAWLQAKNSELKEQNDDFTLVEVTNNLFDEITK